MVRSTGVDESKCKEVLLKKEETIQMELADLSKAYDRQDITFTQYMEYKNQISRKVV